jgi:hypothetical protein
MGILITLSVIMLPQLALTSKTLVGFNLDFIVLCFKSASKSCSSESSSPCSFRSRSIWQNLPV